MRRVLILLLLAACAAPSRKAEETCVIVVTTDGLRWQEVFKGADEGLIDKKNRKLMAEFWRDTPQARREALMPFFWGVMTREGQVLGNREAGSTVDVTNGRKFSYPGYHELLCGFADAKINSNDKVPNPNVTVLEWLNRRPGFEGRVAAFGTWDVLPSILNRERSGLYIRADLEPLGDGLSKTEWQGFLNTMLTDVGSPWEGNALDAFTFHAALDHLKQKRPRVLYVMFGETDEWAHEGRYANYLRAARRADRFVKTLWEAAQAEFPGRVSLIYSTDHGRGEGEKWTDHGRDVARAEEMWMGLMGPGVTAAGERQGAFTQSQIAATAASMVGEDYAATDGRIAKPVEVKP